MDKETTELIQGLHELFEKHNQIVRDVHNLLALHGDSIDELERRVEELENSCMNTKQ